MKTAIPTNGMVIAEDIRLEPGIYFLPEGIIIGADNVTLDGNGAQLIGQDHNGIGVYLKGLRHVTVKNLQISGYQIGIKAEDCQELSIKHCRVFDTGSASGLKMQDRYWVPLDMINGSAILLAGVLDGRITNNDLQHQSHGLCVYSCRGLMVDGNNANHNKHFGFYLFDTSLCKYRNNSADHCSGLEEDPSPVGDQKGQAAGFILINNSSNNQFKQNSARFCDVGFSLVGMSPSYEHLPCMENRFESNNAIHCKFSAFSDAHNRGNVFVGNNASQSGYGILAKYVIGDKFGENNLIGNYRAGIAAENSIHCEVKNNTFQDNRFGVLLWSSPDDTFQGDFPENDTSKFWMVESNTLHRNGTGIRIAANQEAGLIAKDMHHRNLSHAPNPHDHEIFQNVISENRMGIQTINAERTIIKDNQFELNLQGDIKS